MPSMLFYNARPANQLAAGHAVVTAMIRVVDAAAGTDRVGTVLTAAVQEKEELQKSLAAGLDPLAKWVILQKYWIKSFS